MASSCRFGFVGLMLSLVVGCDSNNRAPRAVDDAATTTAGQAVTIQVLQNDDGSELLIITASTDGANGTTQISADRRSVTYTPNANFFGLGILNEQLEEALAQGDAALGVIADAAIALYDNLIENDLDTDGRSWGCVKR